MHSQNTSKKICLKSILFAYDVVLVNETIEDVNIKLELWRNTLESKDFKLNAQKIKYIKCKFNKNRSINNVIVRYKDQVIPKKYQFIYLRPIVQKK